MKVEMVVICCWREVICCCKVVGRRGVDWIVWLIWLIWD